METETRTDITIITIEADLESGIDIQIDTTATKLLLHLPRRLLPLLFLLRLPMDLRRL